MFFILTKFITGKYDSIKIITRLFTFIIFCFISILIFFSIASFVISNLDFSYETLSLYISAILGCSASFSGFVISKLNKQNGLFWGCFAGIVLLLFILILSVYFNTFSLSLNIFRRIIILLISGALGGILGVNLN